MRFLKTLLLGILLLAVCPAWLSGQMNLTGTITGTVSDPSGAVIVGATVKLVDTATRSTRTVVTNSVGNFLFAQVAPGTYDVAISMSGFQTLRVPGIEIIATRVITLNETLKVGPTTQTVEVTATAAAELQTTTATMGATLTNDMLLNMGSLNSDVNLLVNYQPTSIPTFHGAEGDGTGGQVAGATADQNSFILDGGDNTSGLDGDNGYINGFSGDQRGVVPTPLETIEELTINTNNTNVDFNMSGGAQVLAITKRGREQYHGSAYEYFQNQKLDANSWDNNFDAVKKPVEHLNRYGFSAGGPMLPNKLGGKTYFYLDYQALRYPLSHPFKRTVPSDSLRQGIVKVRTSEGVQAFDLTNPASLATVCGLSGGESCDPRMLGMSPDVSEMWNTYMPEPNNFKRGDRLNTFGFIGNISTPLKDDEWTGRIDHDFGAKWHLFSTYRWYKFYRPTTNEVDIGGVLPGDKLGQPVPASKNINQPALFGAGITTTLTPTMTNQFHFNYTKNRWGWVRRGVAPQFSGLPAPIEIDGESTQALIPINLDTQNSRNRNWYEHNYDYREELTWLKGTHAFQFGADWLHEWWHFDRFDNVVGGLTNLIYEIDNGSLHMTPDFQPQTCTSTVTTNCIDTANGNELSTWNRFYADILGITNRSAIVATRSGANLALNPLGTPAASYIKVNHPAVYFSDTWKVTPSVTLTYGLNYSVQFPPFDVHGSQMVPVDPAGNPLNFRDFITLREQGALKGQVYQPTFGYTPVGGVGHGRKYPFDPYYGQFGPRLSAAWSPSRDNGWLGKLFGHKSTVLRGGYARIYGRDLGINVVSNPVLGDGILEPVSCTGPSSPAANRATCLGLGVADPTTAFRFGPTSSGFDGTTVPLPAIEPTLASPVQPGVTAPYADFLVAMNTDFRPSFSDQIDISLQRQLRGDMILEVGYVGVRSKHLTQEMDYNVVPYMMTLGGQQFQQAYASLWKQTVQGGVPYNQVTPQPWFEAAFAGSTYLNNTNSILAASSLPLCSSFTCAVDFNEGPAISTEAVTSLWSDLDTSPLGTFYFSPSLYSSTQGLFIFPQTSTGFSTYNAMVVKLTKRAAKGLTFTSNFTYSHALGTVSLVQASAGCTLTDEFHMRRNYGPQIWDRKFVYNFLGTYELPFGSGHRWSSGNPVVSRLIGGWRISPLFTYGSGLPLSIYTGSFQEMGAGFGAGGATAIPVGTNTKNLSNSPHFGVTVPESGSANPNSVGVNGNADQGGPGINMFGNNAIAVYNSFRPFVLGIDGNTEIGGILRQPSHWVLDLSVTKDTRVTERVGIQIFAQAFNAFNHTNWSAPFLSLQDAPDFGVMSGGYGDIAPVPLAPTDFGRVIQLGVRVHF